MTGAYVVCDVVVVTSCGVERQDL